MFDLDQKLSEWRTRLIESNAYNASDIEELEAHVLDAMDELKAKGLNQEEAFWVAVHRIGDLESLNREFGKVNRALIWRKRAVWLLAGYLIISAIDVAVRAVSHLVFALGSAAGAGTPVLSIATIVLAACLMGAVLVPLFSKKVWDSSVLNRITGMARDHYIVFLISILAFIFAGRMLPGMIAVKTLSGRVVYRMVLVSAYLSTAWLVLMIASLFILLILIKRSRNFAAEH